MIWGLMIATASCGIGMWIGWHARSTKEMLDRRDDRTWDRRQQALQAMAPKDRYLQ